MGLIYPLTTPRLDVSAGPSEEPFRHFLAMKINR
jgi:hypothetical protein